MAIFQVDYKLKAVIISSFVTLSLSCLFAFFSPSRGFELSIYESTPLFFWVGSIFCILCGVFVIVHQVYTKQCEYSNFWIFAFLLLILCRMMLLYTPFIRGYYTWRGDNLTHIGYLIDILSEGYFDANNYYPVTHVLLSELSIISGLPLQIAVNYSTALLSAFYVISIYLVSIVLFQKNTIRLLSVATIGCVLFDTYNVYVMPNGWSLFYIPFIIFLFFRSYQSKNLNKQYKILFIITLILCPFFHPLSSLILCFILMILEIGNHLPTGKYNAKSNLLNIKSLGLNATLLEFIILNMWILSLKRFYPNIQNLYYSIIRGQSPSAIESMGKSLDKINIHGFDFIELMIKMIGDEIIFLIFSLIAGIILLKCHKKERVSASLSLLLCITFVISSMYMLYLFNVVPGLENIGFYRMLSYSVIFTPLFMAFVFDYLMTKYKKYAKILPIFVILTIMMASTISVYSLFASPNIMSPNSQATEMNKHGAIWFIDHKNLSEDYVSIMMDVHRFANAIIGCRRSLNNFKNITVIPDHFNYTVYPYLGCSYSENKYAFISKLDEIVYVSVWKSVGRFDTEDFVRLESDHTVDKLYHNGEHYIYYIHSV